MAEIKIHLFYSILITDNRTILNNKHLENDTKRFNNNPNPSQIVNPYSNLSPVPLTKFIQSWLPDQKVQPKLSTDKVV